MCMFLTFVLRNCRCVYGWEPDPGQAPSPELCSPQDIRGLESQREILEQPFLSAFRKGRWRVPVRDLGKVVHYAKVQLRFQHSQVRQAGRVGGARGQPGACPGPSDQRACSPPGRKRLLPGAVPLLPLPSGPRFQRAHLPGEGNRRREEAGVEGESSLLGRGSPCPAWGPPALPSPHVLWQGLLPLMELSVCPLEGSREHAFQITGVWGA